MTPAQVFISYAHADDQPFDEELKGWVTQFVDKLQKAIAMKPGGSRVNCWMDYRLEPQRAVDPALLGRIRDSQCILAFLSPRYLESEWCRREMANFVEWVGGGKADDRVFLVELLPTPRESWHPGLQTITAIRFWESALDRPEPMTLGWPVPNPKADRAYWRELNKLASILARQIQGLPPIPSAAASASSGSAEASHSAFAPAAAMPTSPGALSVVINADQPDRDLGKKVQDLLAGLEVDSTLAAEPSPDQKPEKYRRDLEAQLDDSHGVLIVYGLAPPSWVQAQHAFARKVLALRRSGIWGALLEGPPEGKPEHGLVSRNLMLLDCRRGLSPDPLKRFVETLRQRL